jgi:hypothetical protein
MSLLNTTDTSSGANVPDAATTTKWKDYIWVRRLGTSGEAKFYIWNENATSDATYLKWQEKSDVVVSDIPMSNGQLLIGGSSNVGTAVALSGDATVANTGVLTIGDGKITNAKVDASAAIAYSKLNLGANVTNANLAGSIGQDKLAGSIPYSKLSLSDGEVPFGKIDKMFEKNINVQAGGTNANGNFPEHSTPTGLAIPEVNGVNGYTGTTKTLEGIYRAVVNSGATSTTITLPDPSSGTYDGKIFKLSIYRGNVTENKGPVYLRIAGKSPTAGSCNVREVTLTMPSGHGFAANDKVSIMGVGDAAGRSYEAENVTLHTVGTSSIQYTLPTAPITSITVSSTTATVTMTSPHPFKTGDTIHISGATGSSAGVFNASHTITRTGNKKFTMTVSAGTAAGAGTLIASRAGLGSWTASGGRGVVVKAFKLVDNAYGLLRDMVEVIPATDDSLAKKIVLDICCDSRSSGDGQWLVSGHSSMQTAFAKTGTTVTTKTNSAAVVIDATATLIMDLDDTLAAGDVLIDATTGANLEVTEDVAAGSDKNVIVTNTGKVDIASGAGTSLTKPPTKDVQFIAKVGEVFLDPDTGAFSQAIKWLPPKPGTISTTP